MSPTTLTILAAGGQLILLLALLGAAHAPLGAYMARVYSSSHHTRLERGWYRAVRVDPDAQQHWRSYLMSVLGFSLASVLALYGLGRLQDHLPWDLGLTGLDPAGAWNTAVSFTTNTNWQWYSGEAAAGHLLQMAGLAVQNFVSAAVGIAVAVGCATSVAYVLALVLAVLALAVDPGTGEPEGAACDDC